MSDLQCPARIHLVSSDADATAVRECERVAAEYDAGDVDPLGESATLLDDLADRHRGEAVLLRVAAGPPRLVEVDGDGRRVSAGLAPYRGVGSSTDEVRQT